MKRLIMFLIALLIFFPAISYAKSSAFIFTHDPIYGKWKKTETKITNQPLYITFIRNYGQPNEQGKFLDSAKITVMEPPPNHANYTDFKAFMTAEAKAPNAKIKIIRDKITFYDFPLGGANGKAIRGQGKVISSDPIFPTSKILGKGYFFDTKLGILEVLIQIQTVNGDLAKLEQDVDSFVSSFRLGLPEDLAIVRWMKLKNIDNTTSEPLKPPIPPFPFLNLFLMSSGLFALGVLFAFILKKKSQRFVVLVVFIIAAIITNSLFYIGYQRKLDQIKLIKPATANQKLLDTLEKRIKDSLVIKDIKAESLKQIYLDAFKLYDQIRLNGTADETKEAQDLYKKAYQGYLDLVVKKSK